jgi:hypothetical protein
LGCICVLSALFSQQASASVIYHGDKNISIPQTFTGIYLDLTNGSLQSSEPGTWASSAWVNPFFGGLSIGGSDHFRMNIDSSTNKALSLAVGTVINSARTYAAGESGSQGHVGSAPGQFQLRASQLIGFAMQAGPSNPACYGWLRLIIDNRGAGTIQDWAYESSPGTQIEAGWNGTAFVVPEPSRSLLWLLALQALLLRRRRS